MSQEEVGSLLGVCQERVRQFERENKPIPIKHVDRIKAIYRMTDEEFERFCEPVQPF